MFDPEHQAKRDAEFEEFQDRVNRRTLDAMAERSREQTAATILAALLRESGGDYENEVIARTAVTLTDALRAELAKERK
jgi:hypothetical protein